MSLHDDRTEHDHAPANSHERASMGEKVAKLEALKERFLLEARAFAEGVKLIEPSFIDRFEFATRSNSASLAEQIEGFCECVADNVSDLIDQGEVERYRAISELGASND